MSHWPRINKQIATTFAPTGPGFFYAEGSAGTLGRCIRCFTSDLPEDAQMFIQELVFSQCNDVDGVPTNQKFKTYGLFTTPVLLS